MTDVPPSLVLPPRYIRTAWCVGGIVLAVAGVVVWTMPDVWLVGPVLLVAAGIAGIRGPRAGVVLLDQDLLVRDYLFSTRIPRAAVRSVDRFPAIDWTTGDDVPHETLVNAFLQRNNAVFVPTDADRAEARHTIQTWIDEGRRPA